MQLLVTYISPRVDTFWVHYNLKAYSAYLIAPDNLRHFIETGDSTQAHFNLWISSGDLNKPSRKEWGEICNY